MPSSVRFVVKVGPIILLADPWLCSSLEVVCGCPGWSGGISSRRTCWILSSPSPLCAGCRTPAVDSSTGRLTCWIPVLLGSRWTLTAPTSKRYIPALNNMPSEYVHSPWKAPRSVQEKAGCIVGEHYPNPICNLCSQSMLCCKRLQFIRDKLQELFS